MLDENAGLGLPRDDLHGAARDPSKPPAGAAPNWTVAQDWGRFTSEEHGVWDLLFERQKKALRGRALRAFDEGLDLLSQPGIPEFGELNWKLAERTGWSVVAVPGLVPDEVFFDHLRNRRFPAGNFIRKRNQLDYLEEPDVFHDVFGHVPMLADPHMADWVQRLGEFGRRAIEDETIHLLARLYWRTVEFGLARENGENRILGAGILSSFGESAWALEGAAPERRPFDLGQVMSTPYCSDRFQDVYFVVERLDELVSRTVRASWRELVGQAFA